MLCSWLLLEPEMPLSHAGCAGSATNVNWKQTTPKELLFPFHQLQLQTQRILSHHSDREILKVPAHGIEPIGRKVNAPV